MHNAMKVLHINQSDIQGGAAIASYRLHQGLQRLSVESNLIVGYPQTTNPNVAVVPRRGRIEAFLGRFTKSLGLNYLQFIASRGIANHSFYKAADILNFHNLHSNYFSYLAIAPLTAKKPAVLTLHDMWSFTGHCAYSYDCDRWKIGCGACPYPNAYPAIDRDNTRLEWRLKQWVYRRSNLTIVAPSRWLFQQAQHSLLNRHSIHYIPYGIDTSVYQPFDRRSCRHQFGIPLDKKVVMFAAERFSVKRKGGDLLIQALQELPIDLKQNMVVLILGKCADADYNEQNPAGIEAQIGIKAIRLGYVRDDATKAMAYSAADLFVFPTRADNLPLVLQESLACGTPIVAFDVGGVADLVRPGITGELATPENAVQLRHKIVQLLSADTQRETMRQFCRKIAVEEYALELQAKRYINLYSQIMQPTR